MRNYLLLLFFLPLISFSQNQISTTDEEYNYLTKGIREQRYNGLDMKKDGYTLELFFETKPNFKGNKSDVSYKFRTFKNTKGDVKAISIEMVFKPTSSNYYCIPINNPELFKMYLKSFDDVLYTNFHAAVAEALAFLASKK
ncbi:hypothetical protein [Flavobacterium lindanitolerans]|uniref:hypothetical protein n=1 Tax=Flavobacterium lindanitolerans TaxID=428988 RepID=UPI0023F28294|nr:hypothetical protein [Flavobacterium lindanitolerans]